jgi:alpha-amylase/alpha-mannosidase (GH57 family)
MGTTHFLFGIHCHQPVDNFHHVVHDAVLKSYRPFFEVLERYDAFRFSIHFSGWLLEFIRTNDPGLFTLMQKMAARGQIEFFGGGYYEPILSVIPSKDRIDQVKKLNAYIKKYFKQTPRGLWLTERVWDSSLVGDMKKCGIEYMLVDDYHFVSTGFAEQELYGYYLTENDGEQMALFPINKTLRYLIPFKGAKGVSDHLGGLSPKEDRAAVLFDDGEKFGVWPKTYEWVYESGWLVQFLDCIGDNAAVKATTYAEFFDTQKPLGLAYLPPYSYYEMGEWSLGAHDAIRLEKIKAALTEYSEDELNKFVKGSIWKNFLVKYYESNHIHKRMLELSAARGEVKDKNYDEWLFKAQTNDVLWHGVFGGLYLPNLRDNAYRFIIEAENIRYKQKDGFLEVNDFNMDGYPDAKYVGRRYIALFDSRFGAQMNEWALRKSGFNLQNTLRRYEESYHDKILNPRQSAASAHSDGIDTIHNLSAENIEGYKEMLVFDWYAKNSFVDHVTDDSFTAQGLLRCDFAEYGDFANQPFEIIAQKEDSITFERRGGIYVDGIKHAATLAKQYRFKENEIGFEITLETQDESARNYLLEMNFHFAQLEHVTCNKALLKSSTSTIPGDSLVLEDPYTAQTITLCVGGAREIVLARIDSVSQSEVGFDLTNQGISIAFVVPYKKKMNLVGTIMLEAGK